LCKNINIKNNTCRIQLWDIAGQKIFRHIIHHYLKAADVIAIVFDFNSNHKITKISTHLPSIESEVAADKMRQFGLPYFEVSAKTGYNIE
jgi:GTPase SAR1 family protein